MFNTFTLTIEGGNEAMQDRMDIASALEKVAKRLRAGEDGGKIMDVNGNTVGKFDVAD